MYEEITRDMTAQEARSRNGRTNWLTDFGAPAGCIVFACAIVSAAVAGMVTLIAWLTSTIPAPMTAWPFAMRTFGITAAILGALTVMLFAYGRRSGRTRGRGAPMTTVETRATWESAVVIWGLMDGELDVLVLRVEPDTAWITNASTLSLKPGATDCPGGIRDIKHIGATMDPHRVPLVKVAPTEELYFSLHGWVGQRIPFEHLPDAVQAAFGIPQ